MVEKIISFSLRNRFIVLLFAAGFFGWGLYSIKTSKIDAIPDLSENQVIVFTEWMGRSPQIIEDQITYPLVTNLQGLPKVNYVRANSMFGMSFIYIIFEDDVDVYWARSRVLEGLNFIQALLPKDVVPRLGPDATGLGQIFWYTVEGEGYDLGQLRSVQDWFVRYQLNAVEGISEVAGVGGFVKQYQITLDPNRLSAYNIPITKVMNSNNRPILHCTINRSDIPHFLVSRVSEANSGISCWWRP